MPQAVSDRLRCTDWSPLGEESTLDDRGAPVTGTPSPSGMTLDVLAPPRPTPRREHAGQDRERGDDRRIGRDLPTHAHASALRRLHSTLPPRGDLRVAHHRPPYRIY